MHLLLALAVACGAVQNEAAKAAEERAKRRLEGFRAELKKCRSTEDFLRALDGLADEPHALILAELRTWLPRPVPEMRSKAAGEIGRFKGDEKAAHFLLSAAKSDRAPEVASECLRQVGNIGVRAMARELTPFFGHKDASVAEEAVASAGALRSRDSVEPLINLLADLEDQKERESIFPGQEEEKRRVDRLLPRVGQALRDITAQEFDTARAWKQWWAKNRQRFKEPEK